MIYILLIHFIELVFYNEILYCLTGEHDHGMYSTMENGAILINGEFVEIIFIIKNKTMYYALIIFCPSEQENIFYYKLKVMEMRSSEKRHNILVYFT